MINPDGVVLGNTRTSVSGKDLNREFTTNNSEVFPELFLIKNLVSKLQRNG
jgi:murein tripeptide amidase MpaA